MWRVNIFRTYHLKVIYNDTKQYHSDRIQQMLVAISTVVQRYQLQSIGPIESE